jgi:hypothetical protein
VRFQKPKCSPVEEVLDVNEGEKRKNEGLDTEGFADRIAVKINAAKRAENEEDGGFATEANHRQKENQAQHIMLTRNSLMATLGEGITLRAEGEEILTLRAELVLDIAGAEAELGSDTKRRSLSGNLGHVLG